MELGRRSGPRRPTHQERRGSGPREALSGTLRGSFQHLGRPPAQLGRRAADRRRAVRPRPARTNQRHEVATVGLLWWRAGRVASSHVRPSAARYGRRECRRERSRSRPPSQVLPVGAVHHSRKDSAGGAGRSRAPVQRRRDPGAGPAGAAAGQRRTREAGITRPAIPDARSAQASRRESEKGPGRRAHREGLGLRHPVTAVGVDDRPRAGRPAPTGCRSGRGRPRSRRRRATRRTAATRVARRRCR